MKKIVLAFVFLSVFSVSYADIVYYKDGTKSEGKILKENKDSVVIRETMEGGVISDTEAPRSLVLRVEKGVKGKSSDLDAELFAEETKKGIVEVSKDDFIEKMRVVNSLKLIDMAVKSTEISDDLLLDPDESVKSAARAKKKELLEKEGVDFTAMEMTSEGRLRKKSNIKPLYEVANRRENNTVAAPDMQRIEVSIVVNDYENIEKLKALFNKVLIEELQKDNRLDALWVIAYREESGAKGMPFAYGIWAPSGGFDDYKNTKDKARYQWDYRIFN